MAISLRLQPREQVLDVCVQVLPVRFLCDPIHSDGRVVTQPSKARTVRPRPSGALMQRVAHSALFALSPLPFAVSVTCFAVSMHPPWFSPKVHTNTGRLCSAGSECQLVPHLHRSYSALRLPVLVDPLTLRQGFGSGFPLPLVYLHSQEAQGLPSYWATLSVRATG